MNSFNKDINNAAFEFEKLRHDKVNKDLWFSKEKATSNVSEIFGLIDKKINYALKKLGYSRYEIKNFYKTSKLIDSYI